MKKRLIPLVLASVILILQFIHPIYADSSAFSALSGLSARSYFVMTSDGEEVLSGNSRERRGMASTTKIMTALVAIEKADVDAVVTVDKSAAFVEGSSVWLDVGERAKLIDLLYAMMLASANDAAAAIAIHISGSIEAFATLMNDKAAELGLENTNFRNPHGLSEKEHYTTAEDLARIAAAALENSLFVRIVSAKSYTFKTDKATRTVRNHNRLLSSLEGAIGIKTGFTRSDGRCLVSAAERNGIRMVAVTLFASDDWRDHEKMMEYAFSLYERRLLAEVGEERACIATPFCENKYVELENTSRVFAAVKKGETVKRYVELDKFSYTEIKKGDTVGRIVYKCKDRTVATVPLTAAENSGRVLRDKSRISLLWTKIKSFFERLFG